MSDSDITARLASLGFPLDLHAAGPVVAPDTNPASLIDHTLLKPEATGDDIVRVCREAREHAFAAVCVNPYWVGLVASELAGTNVKACTVVGFPLGAALRRTKIAETEAALRLGAREIDMVLNVGALRGGDYDAVRTDIRGVVEESHAAGAIVKVILETALLDDAQKAIACVLAQRAGADFVKTSTGFGPGGATAKDVSLMRAVVGPAMGVKAAGGVRTAEDFRTMIASGANRIGTSAGVNIVKGSPQSSVSSAY